MSHDEAANLLSEAWRLRFTDPDRESRFDESRLTSAKLRVRITVAVGLVVMAAMGLIGFTDPTVAAPNQMQAWVIRYCMCVPLWLVFFLSTWSRHFTRRMDSWLSPGIPITCALFTWESITLAYLPRNSDTPVLLGVNVLPLLMVSALAIPFRFRRLMSAVVLSVALPTVMVAVWQPKLSTMDLAFGAANLAGFATCILIAGWWREAMERRLFAQRERVESTNAELERVNGELKRLNDEKNEFMALVAHDLRSPLATIRSLAELLEAGADSPPEERADAIREISDTTDRMLEIVSNFLDVHAAETGQLPVSIQKVNLEDVIGQSVERIKTLAAKKYMRLSTQLSTTGVSVAADPGLLGQVLENLLSNAVKFSPKGSGVGLRSRLIPVVDSASGWVEIEVADEGPGFSAVDLTRVFQKFTRLSARPTGGESSTGLGLALAKRFVEAMGGTIEARNGPAGGAIVALRLRTT